MFFDEATNALDANNEQIIMNNLHKIYNGTLFSHKRNEIELFVVRWMDLESVIQSEISQKEKNTVC